MKRRLQYLENEMRILERPFVGDRAGAPTWKEFWNAWGRTSVLKQFEQERAHLRSYLYATRWLKRRLPTDLVEYISNYLA